MKKTISITLAGRVFEIEEDGYQKLDRYLDGLKQHFAKDGSPDELMADIEASIAEKFSDQLSAHKQAITAQDVDGMITVMGGVNEIAGEDASAEEPAHEEESTVKRFYRNEDDMILGGVCSGIAAYFGIDPLVIRLVFIVLGLVNGLGLLIYLVLWVIMPAAKTNSQKLEMRGKPTNVEEIQELSKEKTEQTRKPDSGIHRLLNIPVVIIGAIVKVIRAVLRVLGPAVSIAIGLCILVGSIIGITATSVTGALLLFRVNSPYIASDLPLNELASRPLYYVGVAAGCIMLFIIGIFAVILATSLIRRKNSFRMLPSAILIGAWVIAAAVGAYAATDIGPWAYARAAQLEEQTTITKEVSVKDFGAIVSSSNVHLTIKQGTEYAATFKGQEQDLNALALNVKDGTLTITQRDLGRHICLFCFRHPIEGEITMPSLTSYAGSDASRVVVDGFTQDLVLSVSDIARAEVTLTGQHVTTTAQDASHLTLTGSASTVSMRTRDIARIVADSMTMQAITVAGEDASRMTLIGTADHIEGTLKDISRVDATELVVSRIAITTHDQSRVDGETPETTTSTDEYSE